MPGFINKEEILKSYFEPQDSSKEALRQSNKRKGVLKSMLYEKENFYILLAYTGMEIKYLNDDQLYEEFDGELPDNIEGEVLLFYNTEDTARILGVS